MLWAIDKKQLCLNTVKHLRSEVHFLGKLPQLLTAVYDSKLHYFNTVQIHL